MIPQTLTLPDGLKLYARQWHLENPKAAIVIVHGLGEHIGRYQHVAEALNAAGYAVVGQDHRGHGKSEGQPRAYAAQLDLLVDDLEPLWNATEQEYKGKPLLMIGHSMGGLLATRFSLRHQEKMGGLITSGVGLLPGASIPKAAIMIGKWLGQIAPQLSLTSLDSKTVSRDPAVVSAYENDPLVFHGKLKAGFGLSLLRAGEDTLARAATLKLSMLIMHGEFDQLVNVEASHRLYAASGSADKTLKIYEGMYHEIFNEPEKASILVDVIRWLDSR